MKQCTMCLPSWNVDYDVEPRVFTTLLKGGPHSYNAVEGIVFQSGRRWSNGRTWLRTRFLQEYERRG